MDFVVWNLIKLYIGNKNAPKNKKSNLTRLPNNLQFHNGISHLRKSIKIVSEIENSLFSPNATAKALICEEDGIAIGFAVYFYNYSTWLGKKGIYLEDLYVSESKRKRGAGKALLKYLAQKALEENCGRFEWSCLDWNTPSREFYESFGAVTKTEWIGYRLEGVSLEKFANN